MPKLKKRLTEVRITSGAIACKVSCPFVVVQSGDRIKFRNQTAGKVHIQVSDDRLFVRPMFTISARHDKTLIVRKTHRGVYPYAVFCHHRARFCTGSSMPIIIVPR